MLNIFGALGAIGRLLPGYVQGERQAVQDNWNDLNQYNTVQHNQMQNAFDEMLFNPRVSQGYDQAANSRMGVFQNGMNLNAARMAYPGAMLTAAIDSILRPQVQARLLTGSLGQANATAAGWMNPAVQAQYATGAPFMYGAAGQQPGFGQGQSLSDLLAWYQQQAAQMARGTPQQNSAVNLPTTLY